MPKIKIRGVIGDDWSVPKNRDVWWNTNYRESQAWERTLPVNDKVKPENWFKPLEEEAELLEMTEEDREIFLNSKPRSYEYSKVYFKYEPPLQLPLCPLNKEEIRALLDLGEEVKYLIGENGKFSICNGYKTDCERTIKCLQADKYDTVEVTDINANRFTIFNKYGEYRMCEWGSDERWEIIDWWRD